MNEENWGTFIRQHLDQAIRYTPPEASERLAKARREALLVQRQPSQPEPAVRLVGASAGHKGLAGHAAVAPLLAFAALWQRSRSLRLTTAALVIILGMAIASHFKTNYDIERQAELDIALLVEDLPPAIFYDEGFDGWLVYSSL